MEQRIDVGDDDEHNGKDSPQPESVPHAYRGELLQGHGRAENRLSVWVVRRLDSNQPLSGPEADARSRDAERSLNGSWSAVDHQQVRARRPFRLSPALFPMPKGVDAEAEPCGERALRHS
jgi:hypothetical protein